LVRVISQIILAVVVVQVTLGCTPSAQGNEMAAPVLRVAAAADLQFAFAEIGALFEEETGGKVIFIFGSTASLASQIENGAPVDVFAAADVRSLDGLVSKGLLIKDTQRTYAFGRIALVGNKKAGISLSGLRDLLDTRVKHIAIANPQHAPYGLAAQQALEASGVWEQVRPKLVYGENVRQALQFVQTGNADAGIVALSIAEVPEVTYVPIEQGLYQPLEQSIAVLKGIRDEELAREFVAFVDGPVGRSVLRKYDFRLPGES